MFLFDILWKTNKAPAYPLRRLKIIVMVQNAAAWVGQRTNIVGRTKIPELSWHFRLRSCKRVWKSWLFHYRKKEHVNLMSIRLNVALLLPTAVSIVSVGNWLAENSILELYNALKLPLLLCRNECRASGRVWEKNATWLSTCWWWLPYKNEDSCLNFSVTWPLLSALIFRYYAGLVMSSNGRKYSNEMCIWCGTLPKWMTASTLRRATRRNYSLTLLIFLERFKQW